jgi:hypothetical protein
MKFSLPDPQRVLRDPAALATLAVNLLPLFGVIAWGWNLSVLVVLYWIENVILGVAALGKIIASGFAINPIVGIGTAGFMGPFFVVHYGMFCAVHGIFVLALFGNTFPDQGFTPDQLPQMVLQSANMAPNMIYVVGAFAALKAGLLLWWLIRGDAARSSPSAEMGAPYGRIIFMHFAIFAGAFAMMGLGQPLLGVAALVVLKTVIDVLNQWGEGQAKAIKAELPNQGPR